MTGVVDTVTAWFLRGGYWPSIVITLLLVIPLDATGGRTGSNVSRKLRKEAQDR